MTEAEWLACGDPTPMLDFLRGKASERKLRLFAVACCKRVWELLNKEHSRKAITVSERYADQLARSEELETAGASVRQNTSLEAGEPVYDPTFWTCEKDIDVGAERCAFYSTTTATDVLQFEASDFDERSQAIIMQERRQQCRLLRCVVHNPFQHAPFDTTSLTFTVKQLAQAIYDDRAFDRLPILADALEEAGCTNADVLNHCRGGGEHTRGCWVIDLILGKE